MILTRNESSIEKLCRQRKMKQALISAILVKLEEVKGKDHQEFQQLFHERIRLSRELTATE